MGWGSGRHGGPHTTSDPDPIGGKLSLLNLDREMVFHPVLSSGAAFLEASKNICLAQREKTAYRMSVTEYEKKRKASA